MFVGFCNEKTFDLFKEYTGENARAIEQLHIEFLANPNVPADGPAMDTAESSTDTAHKKEPLRTKKIVKEELDIDETVKILEQQMRKLSVPEESTTEQSGSSKKRKDVQKETKSSGKDDSFAPIIKTTNLTKDVEYEYVQYIDSEEEEFKNDDEQNEQDSPALTFCAYCFKAFIKESRDFVHNMDAYAKATNNNNTNDQSLDTKLEIREKTEIQQRKEELFTVEQCCKKCKNIEKRVWYTVPVLHRGRVYYRCFKCMYDESVAILHFDQNDSLAFSEDEYTEAELERYKQEVLEAMNEDNEEQDDGR